MYKKHNLSKKKPYSNINKNKKRKMRSKNKKSRRRVNKGKIKKYNVRSRKIYKKMKGGSKGDFGEDFVPTDINDKPIVKTNFYNCGNYISVPGSLILQTPDVYQNCTIRS